MNPRRCPGAAAAQPHCRITPAPLRSVALTLLLGTMLAACGGGGSDSDPVAMVDVPQRDLAIGSAEAVARLAIDMIQVTNVLTETYGLGDGINNSFCESGSGIGDVSNCVIAGNTFSGTLSTSTTDSAQVIVPGSDAPREMPKKLGMSINALTWQQSGNPTAYSISGNLVTTYAYPGNPNMQGNAVTTGTLTLTDRASNARLQYRNLTQRYTFGPDASSDGYDFVQSDQEGDIVYLDEDRRYILNSGNIFEKLSITGNNARIAISYPSSTQYQLDIDSDNDGTYDTFSTMPRSELGRGHTQSTAAPTLSVTRQGGNSTPLQQRIPVTLTASGSDADYNFLTYDWAVACEPVTVTEPQCAQLLKPTGLRTSMRSFAATQPGTYVITVTAREVNTSNAKSATAQITLYVALQEPRFDIDGLDGVTGTVGDTQTFDITLLNPQGTTTAELLAAPTGMTLAWDADTSRFRLTWTPQAQFFPGVRENVVVKIANEDHETVRTFSVTVDDDTASAPLVTAGLKLNAFSTGATLVNLDSDGTSELLLASQGSLFAGYDLDGSAPQDMLTNPYTLDLNARELTGIKPLRRGGSITAYVAASARGVFVVNKNTLTLERSRALQFNLTALTSKRRFDVADLDGDGNDEIIVLTKTANSTLKDQLYVLNQDLTTRVMTEQRNLGQEFLIGNVDADSGLEIVCGNGVVLDGSTLAVEVAEGTLFGDHNYALADVDADGRKEILEADASALRVFDVDTMTRTDITFGTNADNLNLFGANADNDSADELIVGSTNNVVQVFSIDKNARTATLDRSIGTVTSAANVVEVLIGNVTGDSANDVVIVARKDSGEALISVASLSGTLLVDGANTTLLAGDFVIAASTGATDGASFATAAVQTGNVSSVHVLSFADSGAPAVSSPIFNAQAAIFAVAADADNDTVIDLISNGIAYGDTAATIITGAPAAASPWQLPIAEGTPAPLTAAQIDASGNLDVVYIERSGSFGNETLDLVVHETGGAELARTTLQTAGVIVTQPLAVAIANLDGDADADIIVLDQASVRTFEYSAGTLNPVGNQAIGDTATALAVADIDGDGIDDIAVGNTGSNSIKIYSGALILTTQGAIADRINALAFDSSGARPLLLAGTQNVAGTSNKVIALDATSLVEVWSSPLINGAINSMQVQIGNDGDRMQIGTTNAHYRLSR